MHTYQTPSGTVTEYSWDEYMKNKYGNIKVEIDGHKFDSRKEANYYGQLKMRKMAGEIVNFEMQVKYDLVVNGVSAGKYKADFVIQYPDRKEVIDVKGMKTAVYQLKKKLMKAIYGITIIEV